MKHEGITLIALVVTIVVLLILAGISIGVVFDDNGIIKKAQEAANKTEEALINEQEALNSLLNEMNSVIDGSGGDEGGDGGETTTGEINEQIVWSTGTATLTLTVTEPTITIQYKKNNDQSWTNYTTPITSLMHGDKVYVKGVKDGQTVIEEKQIDILDTNGPTVTITDTSSTTNSISATATATDDGAGLGSSPNYIFYLKKSMEQDSAYVQVGSGTTASITKGDLEQNTAYTLKVEVSDIAGNKGQATKEISTSKIADAGEGLVNGAIVASSPTWSGGTASTTLSTNTGLTIQYQKNETSGSWSTGTNVTGLHHNDTVFARLTDGKNYGGEASITILDAVNPQDAGISLSGTSTNTQESITATVTLNDNESGVNVTASKWIYNTNSGYIGTSESSYNNNFSSNGQTITLKSTTVGTYYLHVLTVDNAGNKKETISSAVAVNEKGPEMPDGWDEDKVDPVESGDGETVPVPKGYTASSVVRENTVRDGFVIYEGEEAVTDRNVSEAQTTRNQFVWVPVENVHDMYGTDASSKKWGKLYEFSESEITPLNWTEQEGVMSITNDARYREPDVIREDSSKGVNITQLEKEFNDMIDSVIKYGGFYIGRYETGNLSQAEAVVVRGNTDIANQTWYTMYNKSKGIAANSNVTTTMIWGCQWDAVMRWMYNSGDSAKKTYTYDGTGKGNFKSYIIPSGSNASYAVNNIYDMAGNIWDRTMEMCTITSKVSRGGCNNYVGANYPASDRSTAGTTSTESYGSRIALYI